MSVYYFALFFYFELDFKLKIHPKLYNLKFKNREEVLEAWRKFSKIFCNPDDNTLKH